MVNQFRQVVSAYINQNSEEKNWEEMQKYKEFKKENFRGVENFSRFFTLPKFFIKAIFLNTILLSLFKIKTELKKLLYKLKRLSLYL